MEINIVGLIGVIGSGKSFRQIEYKEKNYIPINFADSVKDLLWDTLNWKPSSLKEERDFKDSYSVTIMNSFKIKDSLITSITGRQLLINFAENMKSVINKNVWVDQTILKIKRNINEGYENFVIGDVRFYNEISALQELKYYREKEFKDSVNLNFIFCNYKSNSYKIKENEQSEELAIQFLEKGYKDGEIIQI